MADNLRPPKKEKTIEDLLNKDDKMMKSPVLWFFLLTIPVILCFYIGLTQTGPATAEPKPVVEYTPEEIARVPAPKLGTGELGERGGAPVCGYQEWVGRQADNALEATLKADKRAYRILPPGSMMTQDYSPSRVNVETDAGDKIVRVWCG